MQQGKVYLIGAGPGDIGLLSLKAKKILQCADTIIYDYLADEKLLRFAKEKATFIYVGKKSNQHTMKQEDISKLLVEEGKKGKIVARLKGGDPFVFGRGGEEALLLQENAIAFEIIPGITSAISVPAYAGIPVTHRGIAASFAVITGHEDPTKEETSLNYEKLATATDTLIFLMGIENIQNITKNLIQHGRSKDTPIALIRWGTKKEQQVLTTTLENAPSAVKKENFKAPAIFIIGEVVNLRQKLAWFDNPTLKPLYGKTIIVTRARQDASFFAESLENLGANVIEFPTIKITKPEDNYKAIDEKITPISKKNPYKWIIFTSENAVHHFFQRLFKLEKDARILFASKIVAIGKKTRDTLKEYGILADIMPLDYSAEGLLKILAKEIKPHDKILIPRAKIAREILVQKLQALGGEVHVVHVYQTILEKQEEKITHIKKMLQENQINALTFTSSSTVNNFFKLIEDKTLLKNVKIIAIGDITKKTAQDHGLEDIITAKEATTYSMVETIMNIYRRQENV